MVDFNLEDQHQGLVCGLDEVGRGPLAGPVVAACVIIPREKRTMDFVDHIRDSKKIAKKKREMLFAEICKNFPFAIEEVTPAEIDELNILQASLTAMSRAYKKTTEITPLIEHALVDGNKIPDLPCKATAVIKGDNTSKTIAAASIVAKVYRDRIMQTLSDEYPHYGWERNSGYPTAEHRHALETHGITIHHRKTFAPVQRLLSKSS